METIGERLQILIKQLNTTAADLAKEIGVNSSSISKWVNNISDPGSLPIAKLLEKHRNINPMWLLLGEGEATIIKEYKAPEENQVMSESQVELIKLQTKYIVRIEEENAKLKEEIFNLKKEVK